MLTMTKIGYDCDRYAVKIGLAAQLLGPTFLSYFVSVILKVILVQSSCI